MSSPDEKPNSPTPSAAGCSILFICTGNTCRSPLAEALCKRLLAEQLGCEPGDLEGRGYVVRSAGIAAWPGDRAAGPAIEAAQELGADLSAHQSRPVNPELLATATHVVAMTRAHAAALALRFPGIGPQPYLLCGEDDDLTDPIGGDLELYRACARTIQSHLERLLPGWVGGFQHRAATETPNDRPDRTGP